MSQDHDHEPFLFPPDIGGVEPVGRAADYELLGELLGAARARCLRCQRRLLDRVADQPDTTARLVGVACRIVINQLGALPAAMLDPELPGLIAPAFRQLAAAGVEHHDIAMYALADTLGRGDRRAAADAALDLVFLRIG